MANSLENILLEFDPISLKELYECRLLNRIDTKYICSIRRLPQILIQANKEFRIQATNNARVFGYESLYFDTPDLKTYFDHHRGKRIRYKIRFRKYLDTGDTFLEVKKKKNYIRTIKRRKQFDFSKSIEKEHEAFINNQILMPGIDLKPNIWTLFNRITLASNDQLERITIDTDIRFRNELNEVGLPGLAIIEVKRNKTGGISPFTQILRNTLIRPYGISKYVMGNILLTPQLKHNRFHKKITTVNKICYDT